LLEKDKDPDQGEAATADNHTEGSRAVAIAGDAVGSVNIAGDRNDVRVFFMDRGPIPIVTAHAERELSAIRKRRGVDPDRARREVRLLVERLDSRDLRHADDAVRRDAIYWAARLHAACRETATEARAFRDRLAGPGPGIDLRVVDALLAEAEGDTNGALQLLRDADTPDIRAALFSTLHRARGQEAALGWFEQEPGHEDPGFFTGIGWRNLGAFLAEAGRWEDAAGWLDYVHTAHGDECPDLLFLEGSVNAALLVPADFRRPDLGLDLLHPAVQTLEGGDADARRSRALACFERATDLLAELGLGDLVRDARQHCLWLRLTSPDAAIRQEANREVASGMRDGPRAVDLVPFARRFGIEYDPGPLSRDFPLKRSSPP
jgi:hypothetical protein